LLCSRQQEQEITKMLTGMLSIVEDFPDYQFVIAGAPSQNSPYYENFITNGNIKFISNKTYDLLKNSDGSFSYFRHGNIRNRAFQSSRSSML
jgi:hypothetical protein